MTTGAEMKVTPVNLARLKRRLIRRALLRRDDGQSLVEFAMVVPVFLILVIGIFQFAIAYNNWLILTEATSLGGRAVGISRGSTLDPCSTASTAIIGAAPSLTSSQLTYSLVLNGTTYAGASCTSSSTTTGSAGNLIQGGSALLTVTYPCSLVVYGKNIVPGCTLQAVVKELVQ